MPWNLYEYEFYDFLIIPNGREIVIREISLLKLMCLRGMTLFIILCFSDCRLKMLLCHLQYIDSFSRFKYDKI